MDLGTLEQQMKATEGQLSQYGPELNNEIQKQIQDAYTPALKNSLETTKNQMGDFLGRYYDTTSMGPGMSGTTAMDLSPTQKLGVMGRELGTMGGELQASQRFSDYLGGQMQDMYTKAQQAAAMGQQNLADQYNRQFAQYQTALQVAEAEKDRALSKSLSGGGGGGFTFDPSQYQTETPTSTPQDYVGVIKQIANNVASQRGKTNTYSFNGTQLGNIDMTYKKLMYLAQQNGVNLNPNWLWSQLGNSAMQSYAPTL